MNQPPKPPEPRRPKPGDDGPEKPGTHRRPPPGSLADMLRVLGVGLELSATIGGMTFVGYLVDRWQDWSPWGALAGALLGIVGGCYNTIRAVRQINSRDP